MLLIFLAELLQRLKGSKCPVQNFIPKITSSTRGQTAEARRTTVLQPVEGKPHSQKDRQNEKAEGLVPDEGTRKNPRKTTK